VPSCGRVIDGEVEVSSGVPPPWSRLNILVVYCHPHAGSFCHALLERVLAGLAVNGHDVDLLDLYAEGFDPVLREGEWLDYLHDPAKSVSGVMAGHVARIERAEGLVFVFPTWFFGLPAMLKGWLDRAWLPGVAFDSPENGGVARSRLRHIRFLATVTTTGLPWLALQVLGFPGQRTIKRGIRVGLAARCRHVWLALHAIDTTTPERRQRFLAMVERRFSTVR
jgi:NAD(P)H dehydrogenase (quinone)